MSGSRGKLQTYLQNYLLSAINTNNGVEAMNKRIKHKYFSNALDKNVSTIIQVIVETYCKDAYATYVKKNYKLSGAFKTINQAIPKYLQGEQGFPK